MALEKISGLLFDLDGVLYVGDQLIEGAVKTIEYIKSRGIACRFVSNTTTRSLGSLLDKLVRLGLPVERGEIITPPKIAADYLRKLGSPKCLLIVEEDTKNDFAEFEQSDDNPDFIVVGNYSNKWDYDLMNRLFHLMRRGTKLLALHKGRFWQTEDGLRIDIGAFVTGLEYVTGQKAIVVGKPEPEFFRLALEDMQLSSEQVAMIGDDIESDIGGAQAVGIRGVLVRTGKYRRELVEKSSVTPDLEIDSVAGLQQLI